MQDDRFVSPNGDQVAAKVMDGEAVLINLATGMYYSMADTATDVWSRIEQGSTVEDMASTLAAKYDVAMPQARSDVERLINELESEGLVTISDGASADGRKAPAAPDEAGLPYSVPTLEKFSDMAEMFALDPPLPGIVDSDRD